MTSRPSSPRLWPLYAVNFFMADMQSGIGPFVGVFLQTVAVPGMVARSLDGTGRINLGQGAVITVQGVGASLSPAIGGWIAQWIGYGPTFLLLGSFGLASTALWLAFGVHVKKY
ncbi:hypothetical protein [Bradyrhizobium genosp. A]|uniref:hypothetical protein n=1 Tax=Bradyrhizobium genosp. A TaxID=83626 RepID=UPI003CF47A7E